MTATTSGIKETITIPLTSSSIGIELLGSSSILIPFVEESSFEYQAVVRDKAGQIMPDQSVTWYLYDQNNLERIEHQGITLNLQTGELMIRDNTQPGIFTVRAVLNSDNVVTASKQVAIHSLKYDFGSEQAQVGYTKVTPTTYYSPELGYGIDPLTPVKAHVIDANRILEGDYIYNDRYFRFQQKLPPGNYQVKITFVDDNPNHIIVAAENVPTQRFRSNQYYDNRLIKGSTSFNGRGEINFQVAVVDGVLDLEIFGDHVKTTQYKAMITALEITKLPLPEASDRPTVHLIGDSTVQGYSAADVMAGWGQMIGEFFGANYSVNNAGIGGRSSASFYREGRLENILLAIKPGDIVLVQLGHNDGTYNNEARYTSNEDYERLYREYYLPGIKQRGATAVVITPVPMHGFTSTSGLGSYVNSAKQVAHATDTFIIDAHNLALDHYNNLPGTQAEKLAVLDTYYVLNKKGGSDYTHFTKPGARKMAELIYHGLVDLGIIKAD